MKTQRLCPLLLVGLVLGIPASASAADTYASPAGDDNANCLTPATACQTIGGLTGALSKASAGATVHAAPTSYLNETITLDNDKKLLATSSVPAVTIQGAAGVPAITIAAGSSDSRVEGFTINSPWQAISVQAGATITGNIFDQTAAAGPNNADVDVLPAAGSPVITNNTFDDVDGAMDIQRGVISFSTGSPLISGNVFEDLSNAIFVGSSGGATPRITGNEITGTHDSGSAGNALAITGGVSATVTANYFHAPGASAPTAIFVFQNSPTPNAAASLHRNRIIGHQVGVAAGGTLGAVTLDSDLIAKTQDAGVGMFEGANPGGGDVTATNVTVIDSVNGSSISIGDGATLTMDSSIVSAGGVNKGVHDPVSGNCVISFSRGDGNGDCASGFTSTADPAFVNTMLDDYRLMAGSSLIDMGNPAAPALLTDLAGLPRALDGPDTDGVARRDMGAYELPDTFAPGTTIRKKPKKRSSKAKAKFGFTSTEAGSSFRCKLDKKAYKRCPASTSFKVKRGKHTLRVQAIDLFGNADPSPAVYKFRRT